MATRGESIKCPRDDSIAKLDAKTSPRGNITLDVCKVCKGVWFDGGELEKLSEDYYKNIDTKIVTAPLPIEREKGYFFIFIFV